MPDSITIQHRRGWTPACVERKTHPKNMIREQHNQGRGQKRSPTGLCGARVAHRGEPRVFPKEGVWLGGRGGGGDGPDLLRNPNMVGRPPGGFLFLMSGNHVAGAIAIHPKHRHKLPRTVPDYLRNCYSLTAPGWGHYFFFKRNHRTDLTQNNGETEKRQDTQRGGIGGRGHTPPFSPR